MYMYIKATLSLSFQAMLCKFYSVFKLDRSSAIYANVYMYYAMSSPTVFPSYTFR